MSHQPLTPWRDGHADDDRRAAELVQRAHEINPRPMDVGAGWDAVLKRATKPRTSGRLLLFAGALAMLAGVVGTATVLRSREPVVVAAQGTQWEKRDDGAVQLQVGRIQTPRAVTMRVESPQVTLLARECRFAAEVIAESPGAEAGTRITIYEGSAVVRSGQGVERTLSAGESVLWPATPVIPAALAPTTAPRATACTDTDCLERAVKGEGVEAEVALFELARRQPQRSIELWRASLERFPDGVFEPEVRLRLLVTLTEQRKFAAALDEARAFERDQSEDPRVEEVRALRRQLEWLTTRR